MNDSVKQRLIGAIVLLIICASIWPIIFPSAEQAETIVESLIPPPPALEIFEIPKQAEPKPTPSIITVLDESRGPLVVNQIDKTIDTSVLARLDEQAALPSDSDIDAEVDTVLTNGSPAWAIQLGAFSSLENAEKLAQAMRDKNYSVVMQRRRHNGQELAFVFLGPYLLKSQADKLGEQLVAAGSDVRVVEFKP